MGVAERSHFFQEEPIEFGSSSCSWPRAVSWVGWAPGEPRAPGQVLDMLVDGPKQRAGTQFLDCPHPEPQGHSSLSSLCLGALPPAALGGTHSVGEMQESCSWHPSKKATASPSD